MAGKVKRANPYEPRRDDALWPRDDLTREAFAARVWEHGAEEYRELPWRDGDDPYAVLVSEIMLQQTQVSRVERYWPRWLEAFPTLEALAAAPVARVLELWQGLGYNRRALALKRTAETVTGGDRGRASGRALGTGLCALGTGLNARFAEMVSFSDSVMAKRAFNPVPNAHNPVPNARPDARPLSPAAALPETFDELIALPGIGPATAAGVMAFAYQQPSVYVETNVRAVFLHELFPDEDKVPDADLLPYVADLAATAGAVDPRSWYYALLDWGAALKRSGVNPTRASTTYARQSTFEGSRRQKRAELVRIVLANPDGVSVADARAALDAFEAAHHREAVSDDLFASLLADLQQEGFLYEAAGTLRVP